MSKSPVLLVNDDPELLGALVKACEEANVDFQKASTATDALHIASLYDFSLAFVDLHLPDMSGEDFYAKLLEKEAHYTLPLVTFIDGLDSHEVQALNAIASLGQITLLSKPPKAEWISKLIQRHAV